MITKHRIAAVSYINTLPFIDGLKSPRVRDKFDIILAHPARCAELLKSGDVDIALCPVGALPEIREYHVITDYCIGCDGSVRTVCVYSHRPLSEIKRVVLSSESRTSNILVQILDREYWQQGIEFVMPGSGTYEQDTGFLHIGDICFEKEKVFPYRTDLGRAWKDWTGLPFAFACWVSREQLEIELIALLNSALSEGVNQIDALNLGEREDAELLRTYLKDNISFEFDAGKQEALRKFIGLMDKHWQ